MPIKRVFLLWLLFSYQVLGSEHYAPEIAPPALQADSWTRIESLPDDHINNFTIDEENRLWVGVPKGIISYDGAITRKYDVESGLKDDQNYLIKKDKSGQITAISKRQLYRLQGEYWQSFGPQIKPEINFRQVKSFYVADGAYWVVRNKQLLQITEAGIISHNLSERLIEAFLIDKKGYFWLLQRGTGTVLRFSYQNGQLLETNRWENLVTLTHPGAKLLQLTSGNIWLLTRDKKQPPLWIAGDHLSNSHTLNAEWREERYPAREGYSDLAVVEQHDGSILLSNEVQLSLYQNGRWLSASLEALNLSQPVEQLEVSGDGIIWLYEKGNSIRRMDTKTLRQIRYNNLIFGCESGEQRFFLHRSGSLIIHHLRTHQWRKLSVEDGIISTPNSVLCTQHGDVFVSGSHLGQAAVSYNQVTKATESTWTLKPLTELGVTLGHFSALETLSGRILLGNNDERLRAKSLLVQLRKQHSKWQVDKSIQWSSSRRAAALTQLTNGTIVVGGFSIAELIGDKLEYLKLPSRMLPNWIEDVRGDDQGNLWVATWDYGVLRYDQHWKQFSLNSGLSDERISSLLPLEDGNLLALTGKGVERFDGNRWQLVDINGVTAIREGSSLIKGADHGFWVNQASRQWMFRAQEDASFTGDHFYTIHYTPNNSSPFVVASLEAQPEHYENSVLITWQGKDSWSETPTDRLHFSYRINGGEWSPFSPDTSGYFSQLQPNHYLFEVRARDGDGNISQAPAQLLFEIKAPFWKQSWFLIAAFLAPITILVLLVLLVAQRLRQTSRLNEMRMQFLTNISHELRNPLSLVITPLESLSHKNQQPALSHGLELALRNAQRLKQLIDQLLEYRRLQAGHTHLVVQQGDLVSFIQALVNDLQHVAAQKSQLIDYQSVVEHFYTEFDHDVLRKIVDNLLTNAFKYSGNETMIQVRLRFTEKGGVVIEVEDQGIGISAQAQKSIFEPFYTSKKRKLGNPNSFGIGLAFVKNLVELSRGQISVQSPPPDKAQGSLFCAEFPTMQPVPELNTNTQEQALASKSLLEVTDPRIHLLIADDNRELADYLKHELADDFNCTVVYDGASALEQAKTLIPDVILSDLKMPQMDGLQLCEALKSNQETSHIPVLLHSAMSSEQHQLAGLAVGAVDYLAKPASVNVIRNRINALMRNREQFAHYLQLSLTQPTDASDSVKQEPTSQSDGIESFRASLKDEVLIKFIDKLREEVLNNYQRCEFTAESLATAMHMSRSAFYRKFKALTNMTPAEYIKQYRLMKAEALLEQGNSVAMVSDSVGYRDASSFNRAFKSRYGVAPSQFKQEHS